jgi:hypothetical protein
MRAEAIRIGDVLRLKRNNVYGLGDVTRTVVEIREKPGYRSVWIISDQPNGAGSTEAFKPSDFSGHA